ncbi:GNAT family N-acetyltransferase [Shewanella colwelliana]|uniref:GNAT family N-acetyltransferase n=1 Tax=Shewanella colwelliana TaxID=23 RepID=UPI003D082F8E
MQIANSPRLQFEMITYRDADLLFELDQDPQVMRYINGGTPSTMSDITERFIPRVEAFTNVEKGWGLWKVTTLASEDPRPAQFIGWILVRPMDFFSDQPNCHDIEIGWRFKRCSWGKGYATEAAHAVADAIAAQPEVTHLSAIADDANFGSINIMKKLGMDFIKVDTYDVHGRDVDVVCYQKRVK